MSAKMRIVTPVLTRMAMVSGPTTAHVFYLAEATNSGNKMGLWAIRCSVASHGGRHPREVIDWGRPSKPSRLRTATQGDWHSEGNTSA